MVLAIHSLNCGRLLQETRRQQLYRQKYSQEIASNRNCADYNDALRRIENNSDFFSFNRYLHQETEEIDIENSLLKVNINFIKCPGFKKKTQYKNVSQREGIYF